MSLVLADLFERGGRVFGGVLRLEGEVPQECLVSDAMPPEGWMWPDRIAARQAMTALLRSLVVSIEVAPTLIVCPEDCAEAVREGAPFVPVRAVGTSTFWFGTAPFSAHPAARLAEGFAAEAWLARLRRGILQEAGRD